MIFRSLVLQEVSSLDVYLEKSYETRIADMRVFK
jgi:hypothetical protein